MIEKCFGELSQEEKDLFTDENGYAIAYSANTDKKKRLEAKFTSLYGQRVIDTRDECYYAKKCDDPSKRCITREQRL